MTDALPDWIVWSRFPLRPVAAPERVAPVVRAYGDWVLDTIAPEVDQDFYRVVAGLGPDEDPVRHCADIGWQAGLNPNSWFDTRFYLAFYPDIAEAGMNPLFHFAYYGRAEGRMPARPGGLPRHVVEQARVPSRRPPGWDAPEDVPVLELAGLLAAVAACLGATGLVLSVSHDCYVNVTGGMQILIADEQALFNADRTAYLHIAPAIARFTFAPADAEVLLQVSVDGVFLGLAPEGMVEAVLRAGFVPEHRVLIVHSVLGHRAAALVRMVGVLRPTHGVFWLHDYAALCEGFNLLRNDVAYCGAPPAGSTACRICVYGAERVSYLAALERVFAAVGFHVVAPSRVALDLFLARSSLPFRTARVHDNLAMAPGDVVEVVGDGAPRVAFAGFAIPRKGWPHFQHLLQRQAGHDTYRFHHFAVASNQVKMTGLVKVDVQVRAGDRFAMVEALPAHGIDLVAVLSPWPETFSFVVHEAFASGADVVALADGGNVAAAVRRYGRGVVLREAADVVRFFEEGWALDYARQRAAEPVEGARLVLTGTSATIDPGALAPVGLEELETGELGLAVVLGDGRVVAAEDGLVFSLPAGVVEVLLVSRHALPLPDAAPRGVAVARLVLDGVAVGLDDARLAQGWHPAQGGVRWTGGRAVLRVAGRRRLEIGLAAVGRWRRVPLAAG